MNIFRRTTALLLALILISGSFMCFAADSEKQFYDYKKVMLLGDSEASGYSDYGGPTGEFARVDDSYAAYVADDLGAEYLAMACPGFRTIELRYMLDDTYRPDDKFLFRVVPNLPQDVILAHTDIMRQGIKESDLIIIGIGGNDWGAYLGWVMADVQKEFALPEEYKAALRKYLSEASVNDDIIAKIVELADYFNSLDELAAALPVAMKYGFSNLRENWTYIMDYIYENNPDATVAVVGMFPTYLKTEKDNPDVINGPDPVSKVIEEYIIDYGNKHMIENQEKYGYIYVDTTGTVVQVSHPTPGGHRHIADRILEELPDARFQYKDDVSIRNADYKAIEYVAVNGIMQGTSETTFGPDEALTEEAFSKALNKINDTYKISDGTKSVSKFKIAYNLYKITDKSDLLDFIDIVRFSISILSQYDNDITRVEFAEILYNYILSFRK